MHEAASQLPIQNTDSKNKTLFFSLSYHTFGVASSMHEVASQLPIAYTIA